MIVLNALKSPDRMAAVGRVPVRVFDVCSYVPSQAPKKKSLFLTMGPPRVAPSILRWLLKDGRSRDAVLKKFLARSPWSSCRAKPEPWNSLVPDLVSTL